MTLRIETAQHIPRPPNATLGGPAPWAGAATPALEDIRAALASGRPPVPSPFEATSHTASAVLLAVVAIGVGISFTAIDMMKLLQ